MKNLLKALALFQDKCPPIDKDAKGYGYNYASLERIHQIVNPILRECDLLIVQRVETPDEIPEGAGAFTLITDLYHVDSGEVINSSLSSTVAAQAKMNNYQALGSGITYLRRYALSAILNLVTEEDSDAKELQDRGPQEKTKAEFKDDRLPQLSWLNPQTEAWDKAVEYLKNGGTLQDIKKKYKLSKANSETLIDQAI